MRSANLLGGLLFSFCAATGGVAHANAAAQSSQASSGLRFSSAQGPRLYTVKQGWVVRTGLPGHGAQAAQRIKVLKQSMEDEIEGTGHFANDADTPAFEIVSHGADLHQVAEAGYGSSNARQNGGVARYQVKASELKGGKLDVTALLPVSGHVGLSSAKSYAKSNVFRLQVNGGAWQSIPARGKYVTEKSMQLALKPGMNQIMMEPYSGGFGGYTQGRTVEIEVVK